VEKRGLNLDVITRAAVALLDDVGLAELSTRRLAAKLGVQSPTLYWHVKNKAELLDLVAEAICADAFDIPADVPWREQLASGLRQFRALLTAHRDAAELLRVRPPGPRRLRHIETTVGILLAAGFSADDAAGISRLLSAHVLASVPSAAPGDPGPVIESMADYPNLAQVGPAFDRLSPADLFDLGVAVILDGLEQRLLR
jgi:TetR/AcrR family transcriptional regulator, tetracycline repressor protein